ncbi:unnamed protein product, partial [Musa textilis]
GEERNWNYCGETAGGPLRVRFKPRRRKFGIVGVRRLCRVFVYRDLLVSVSLFLRYIPWRRTLRRRRRRRKSGHGPTKSRTKRRKPPRRLRRPPMMPNPRS